MLPKLPLLPPLDVLGNANEDDPPIGFFELATNIDFGLLLDSSDPDDVLFKLPSPLPVDNGMSECSNDQSKSLYQFSVENVLPCEDFLLRFLLTACLKVLM